MLQADPLFRARLTLHRLALITLQPKPIQGKAFDGEIGDVKIQTLGPIAVAGDGEALRLLVAASSDLAFAPKLTRDGLVVVPDAPRSETEAVIESAANLIAVAERCRRVISSPIPPVAFEAKSSDAKEWLRGAAGILNQNRLMEFPNPSSVIGLDPQILKGLTDRVDGVALLAEAFAQGHAVGRFRDFFRLFERAFALPARRLGSPLAEFVHERFGYTRDEIDRWVELRDPATHADSRPTVVLEPDVRPVVAPLEQSALDVLMNKAEWRDPSPARRELWAPNGWTCSPGGDVKMLRASTGRYAAQLLDQFGIYPCSLEGAAVTLPAEWWSPAAPARSVERRLEVIEE